MLSWPTIDRCLKTAFIKTQNYHPAPGADMHDISESPFWESIRTFLKSEYHLVFATYIDWFNPLGNIIITYGHELYIVEYQTKFVVCTHLCILIVIEVFVYWIRTIKLLLSI